MTKAVSRRKFNGLLLGTASMVGAPFILSRPAGAAEFNLKYANNQQTTHPMNVRATQAVEKMKQESNGRIDVKIFPNNQLGGDTDMLSQIRSGAIDFFTTSGLIVQTVVPVAGANGLGFAFPNYDAVWAAMDGDFGAYLRKSMEKANVYTFDKIWDNGFRQMTSSRRPIFKPADLAGLKIRVPVMPLMVSMMETLGASPTSINIKEAYSALQTHLVDCQENPLSIVDSWKFYEVQKYCSYTNHMWDGFWMLANLRKWQVIPRDMLEIISRNWNEAGLAERVDIKKLNDSLQSELETKGMVFNKADTDLFREKLSDGGFYKKWKGEFGDEAWILLEKAVGKLA